MDELDVKLLDALAGKVVRKDLLHRIKKGTNVPTFVLEFLLARYCASDEPDEIQAGLEAVFATLQDNYVRPDEANAAQSRVATKGRHRFIDKVHVNYVEKEKRHWAALENFGSQRISIAERFYRDNDRLLEGGIWAEVTIGYNDMDEDSYAFYVEDLRPIQLSRFDFDGYAEGRRAFSRDEWLDIVLRSVGLEPSKLTQRLKLHFILRLASLVEPNFNFIELGPRGTGKSYFFSEFSPYATLISGGQATKAVLFYNNARRRLGLVGFWDTVAFDEVAGIKVRDPDMMQIMKDFMANGRFSRGVEVIADASMAFVGNIDHSIEQLVASTEHDLFISLPKEFDLAIMDRFACYLPGWEMVKTSSEYLTEHYGLITDYLAEAFHYQFAHTNRYEEVTRRIRLGPAVEGRDEKGIKKTVSAFLKILHPDGPPSDTEFEEYVAHAVECRRRVKEQMNKRKPDDEFANIDLSYFASDGRETIVYCPESRDAQATQQPSRPSLAGPAPSTEKAAVAVQAIAEPYRSLAAPVLADMLSGESANLEYKSSMRWDLHQHKVNRDLEKVIAKSVAGFLNSDGGTLLIGVADDCSVLGIGHDLKTIGRKDRDGYERALRQVLTNALGAEFSQYQHVSFDEIESKTVCIVQVEPSPKPVYLTDRGTPEFYVRIGPATQPLDMQAAHDYINMHWPT